jgi:3alpha(or 20beta)-hydroxysteroid dehydrogenase
VIVTGGAGGMGQAESEVLSDEGWIVITTDITGTADVEHDVTDPRSWQLVVDEVVMRHGRISGLVNNAGVYQYRSLLETDPAEAERIWRVNFLGAMLGIQAVAPVMARTGGGAIVNLSSITGRVGIAGHGAYGASKWALRGLTRTAAVELGPLGIRVNAVLPGAIDTPMLPFGEHERATQFAHLPVGRIGTPIDVAGAVSYLLSDAAAYVTGAELAVDGGSNI